MIKQILIIILVLIGYHTFSQGNLKITASQNETFNLNDNESIDVLVVKIISIGGGEIKSVIFSNETKYCQLTPGYYNLEIATADGKKEIKICEILIRDFEFTFINILFEPCGSLSRKEMRRRKIYDNYRKVRCV
ncbi:MAG: hypothetical protein N4A41_00085 [Crocinitomicaceae bacterium]|jgi:hypothetical protein|nr:hypothetical protein [Crocinitomicaceae bacterium]